MPPKNSEGGSCSSHDCVQADAATLLLIQVILSKMIGTRSYNHNCWICVKVWNHITRDGAPTLIIH